MGRCRLENHRRARDECLQPLRLRRLRRTKDRRLNNIELISDRPIEVNLREMAETKRLWPDRAVVASLMVEPNARYGMTS